MADAAASGTAAAVPVPVRERMRDAFSAYPDRVALVTDRVSRTFRQLGERALRLASLLEDEGARPGDFVGVVLSSRPELGYDLRLALVEHGAGSFALPPLLEAAHLQTLVLAVKPRLVVYEPAVTPRLPEVVGAVLPACRFVAAGGGDDDFFGRLSAAPRRETREGADPDAIASLGFTSGTTGSPKGVTSTFGATAAACAMWARFIPRADEPAAWFNGVPIFAAGSGLVLPALAAGVACVVPDRFDAAVALSTITRERAVGAFLTPSMLADVLDLADLESRDLSCLKTLVYGSAPTMAPRIEEAVRRLGPVLLQGYGMAECLPPVAILLPEEHGTREAPARREVLTSTGFVSPGVRVAIESASGAHLGPEEAGEIVIQSPTATRGYWNDEERTRTALRGGWFHSGDRGFFDREGRLHVVDRIADLIERGSVTVAPRTIEEAASEHPAVKEAAAVTASSRAGITLAVSLRRALKTRREGAPDAAEILRFVADRVPPEARPDEVVIFAELPRSVQGKVLKREVRDALAARRGERGAS